MSCAATLQTICRIETSDTRAARNEKESAAAMSPEAIELGPWLAEHGLVHVDGGIAMRRPAVAATRPAFSTFALASQALG